MMHRYCAVLKQGVTNYTLKRALPSLHPLSRNITVSKIAKVPNGDGKGDGNSSLWKGKVLLAKQFYDAPIDPTGWWMSEKYDGVRAIWNGSRLVTRNGVFINAPEWFLDVLPNDECLDGELWMGRDTFNECSGLVRRDYPHPNEWNTIKYAVFDVPFLKVATGEAATIEIRNEYLQATLPPFATDASWFAVASTECTGREHMDAELTRVLDLGGEGLMLRESRSPYLQKRHKSLLKVTPTHTNEAIVIGYLPGKKSFEGMMGALQCELRNGIKINIGTGFSNAERANPPELGSVAHFNYRSVNVSGQPRFASYIGLRYDVDLTEWKQSSSNPKTDE